MFSAEWLALREPADFAARSQALTRAIAAVVTGGQTLNAVDLACGTGSNARYIAGQVRARQDWLLVDYDSLLLDLVPSRMSAWAAARAADMNVKAGELRVTRAGLVDASFRTRRADLRALDDPMLFDGRNLVVASALLDLVSEPWVRRLAHACRAAGAAALFALTYDGRIACTPREKEDETVRRLVNDHQRTNKGFGEALGPAAVDVVERRFAEVGYRSRREQSDWVLFPGTINLQRQLIEGWSDAATAMAPREGHVIAKWRVRRLSHVDRGRSQIIVGHQDIAFWPA